MDSFLLPQLHQEHVSLSVGWTDEDEPTDRERTDILFRCNMKTSLFLFLHSRGNRLGSFSGKWRLSCCSLQQIISDESTWLFWYLVLIVLDLLKTTAIMKSSIQSETYCVFLYQWLRLFPLLLNAIYDTSHHPHPKRSVRVKTVYLQFTIRLFSCVFTFIHLTVKYSELVRCTTCEWTMKGPICYGDLRWDDSRHEGVESRWAGLRPPATLTGWGLFMWLQLMEKNYKCVIQR